jgi:hypothetical protein
MDTQALPWHTRQRKKQLLIYIYSSLLSSAGLTPKKNKNSSRMMLFNNCHLHFIWNLRLVSRKRNDYTPTLQGKIEMVG